MITLIGCLFDKIYPQSPLIFIEIQGLAKPITTATMELYERIVRDLPPTPSKFHYIFNLRDLSRIYHGLSLTIPDRYDSVGSVVRVWRNECLRVFYDRLTNDKDKALVKEHVSELMQEHFSSHAEVINYRKPFLEHQVNCLANASI